MSKRARNGRRGTRQGRTAVSVWKVLVIAAAICAVLVVVSVALPDAPEPVAISASVHQTGRVSLMFSGRPTDATSPACGCFREAPPGGWRGIVLPAQELELQRAGAEPTTRYDLFAAAPEQLASLPRRFGLPHQLTYVAVPRKYANRHPARVPRTARRVLFQAAMRIDWLTVLVRGPLHVRSFAREPVAALSPPHDRWTTIEYGAGGSMFVATGFNMKARRPESADGVPMVDVLGPDIDIWGRAGFRQQPTIYHNWSSAVPTGKPGERHEVTDDKTIVVPQRAAPRGWVVNVLIQTARPLFAARLVAYPTGPTDDGTARDDATAGQFTVAVPHAERDAHRLVPKFAKADRHPRVSIRDLPAIPSGEPGTARNTGTRLGGAHYIPTDLEFEYPPTPPLAGINVFGGIRELRFAEATADLTVGTEPRSLQAPTPLELRNITGRGVVRHHMLVPVRIDASGARINVIGRADARINGLPVTVERPWVARVLSKDTVTWFLGLLAAVAGVAALRFRSA